VIFFTDENISKRAAYMLDSFERQHQVRAYLDYFDRGVPDTDWIPVVASWNENDTTVAICGDGRILKNKVEKQVLKEYNLMFVYLAPGWTNIEWSVFGWKIVKVWPNIVKNVEQASYAMVFEVAVGNLKIQTRGRISNL